MKDDVLKQLENKTLREIMDEAKANQKPIPITTQLLFAASFILCVCMVVFVCEGVIAGLTMEQLGDEFIDDILHPYEGSGLQKIIKFITGDTSPTPST